jgi:putative oxidoreductase
VTPETRDLLWIAGRTLLGGPFVVGGIRHCFHFPPLAQMMAARGVPAAKFVLAAGTALQILAGAAVIAGFQLLWAVAALIVFTIVASVMFLNFWNMQGPERVNAVNALWGNVSIIGGLLVVAAHAGGNPG